MEEYLRKKKEIEDAKKAKELAETEIGILLLLASN